MQLNATDFRKRVLSLLEKLPPEGVVITKHGKPVARVLPIKNPRKGRSVTLPLILGKGAPGPLAPTTETPYDLLFD